MLMVRKRFSSPKLHDMVSNHSRLKTISSMSSGVSSGLAPRYKFCCTVYANPIPQLHVDKYEA